MSSHNMEILNKLKCPKCTEYMIPPIYLCSGGHSICRECILTTKFCATCSWPVVMIRNYSLESISASVSYPCPNYLEGCAELIQRRNLPAHEKICRYRFYPCVLAGTTSDCNFKGRELDLEKHYLENHRDDVWMDESTTSTITKRSPKFEIKIIFCFGAMFYVYRQLLTKEEGYRTMFWVMQFVGSVDEAESYTLVVKLSNKRNFKNSTFQYICHDDTEDAKLLIESGLGIGVSENLLNSFKDSLDNISYTIAIKPGNI